MFCKNCKENIYKEEEDVCEDCDKVGCLYCIIEEHFRYTCETCKSVKSD